MIRYEKTIWENDKTPVNAQHLGKVEDGLEYLFDVVKDVPAGEDARIANEKQRQVNETTRQNNEIKRNDTLNTKVEEVDNAIAASNNNIKEVNNKFETIVASKQQDAEVILARGKYPSLPTRLDNLDKDLLNIKDTAIIPITTEKNFETIKETVNGYLKNFKLEGRTFVNIYNATLKVDEELQLKMSQNTIKNFSNTVTVIGVNKPISIGIFKNDVWVRDINIPSLPHLLELNEGEYVDTIVGLKSKGWTSNDFNDFKKIFVVSGDCIKTTPRFFEGMKSVGDDAEEIVVSSCTSNLLKPLTEGKLANDSTPPITMNGDYSFTFNSRGWGQGLNVDVVNVKKDETYYIIADEVVNGVVKGENALASGDVQFVNNKAEIVAKSTGKANIILKNSLESAVVKFVNVRVVKKGCNEVFVPHKENKKKILYYDIETQAWKKPILREWDSIEERSNGKYYYHKRGVESTLNGSETKFQPWGSIEDSGVTNFVYNGFDTTMIENGLVICDKLSTRKSNERGKVGVNFNTKPNGFEIGVKSSELSSQDQAGIQEWLQRNNLTLVYQSAQEKVYECTPIDLMTFENETNYMVECGAVTPKSSFKYEGNIGNVINTLKEKVSNLEDKLYKTNLANFTVALNALDTKLKLEQLTRAPK